MDHTSLDLREMAIKVFTEPASTGLVSWESLADCLISGTASNGIAPTHEGDPEGHAFDCEWATDSLSHPWLS